TGLVVAVGELLEVVEIVDAEHHYVVLDFACSRAGGELRAGDDARAVAFVDVATLAARGCTEAVARVVAAALARPAQPPEQASSRER
ncbi:MAG TPA: hypothetical protein VHB21_25895, partial [Minicystis sp.]|nr:hypothetical protein [Minicystis sp.]